MRDLAKSERLHREALALATVYLSDEKELFRKLIEIEEDQTYLLHESGYLTPYMVKVLHICESRAEDFVRVIRKGHEVPELLEAVITGKVHLSKAKTIVSVITKENKDEWIKNAASLSKQKLERAISVAKAEDKKKLTLHMKHDAYDKLVRARDIECSKRREFVSLEDAIDAALTVYLYYHDPIEKAERAKAKREKKECSQEHFSEHDVVLRDQEQCQFVYKDGSQCEEKKWLDKHHIKPRAEGGEDSLDNLVTLCSAHHRIVHGVHLH